MSPLVKRFILVLFCLLPLLLQGQDPRWTNIPNYDLRKFHFGFTLAVNRTAYKAAYSNSFGSDSAKKITTPYTQGFTLGFVVNMMLHDQLDLRILPSVGFYDRAVNYKFTFSEEQQRIESTFIELPLLLKYKSIRRKNQRLYLLGGVKLGIEAGAKKNEKRQTELRTNPLDFSIEYGVGMDLYMPYFKFAPEIRVSHGIVNLLVDDPNIYSQSLKGLFSHTITLFFHFE
jgi:hypothetical protein